MNFFNASVHGTNDMKLVTKGWKLTVYSLHTKRKQQDISTFFFAKSKTLHTNKQIQVHSSHLTSAFNLLHGKVPTHRMPCKSNFLKAYAGKGSNAPVIQICWHSFLVLCLNYEEVIVTFEFWLVLTLSARGATRDPLERVFQNKLVSTMIYETSYKRPLYWWS